MENRIEIYSSLDGIEVNIVVENECVLATQKQMAEIFDTIPQNVTLHLKKVYKGAEIEGKRKEQRFYNLDSILSVFYRVNSKKGTQFRQWAKQRLKDYFIKFKFGA